MHSRSSRSRLLRNDSPVQVRDLRLFGGGPRFAAGLHYWKADFVTELTDDAITAHVEHGRKTPHMSSTMHLYPINGAAHRVGQQETAFGHRDKNFAAVIAGMWPDPADNEANTKWVKDLSGDGSRRSSRRGLNRGPGPR